MPTNFLWNSGVTNNGLLTTALNLMTTEIESLTSASVTVSSVNGSSGVFGAGQTAQGMWGDIYCYLGNPGINTAMAAGANVSGWFLTSFDGGTTFESTTVAPPRGPDFIIALPATTVTGTASPFKTGAPTLIPALEFKVLFQNNTGFTLGNGATTAPYLKLAPFAIQY